MDNPSIRIYLNGTEDKIRFKTETSYYIDILTPKAMKLL